ncbi:MAG: ribosome maturation factor, partial [Pseudomonadota bacterium]|nr:ribosome maturation factor [Pseudomonadota bacterium]
FKGVLAGFEDGNVLIDLDGEDDTALIPFDWLSDAKLVLTDALMKRGAAIRAARGEPEDDGLPEGEASDLTTDTTTPSEDNA